MLGVWSDATDEYDSVFDLVRDPDGHTGYTGVYHEQDAAWGGPTGQYRCDFHGPLTDEESTAWSPIYLWATPDYVGPQMALAFKPVDGYVPPSNRTYTVELLYVPPGVNGAPPVGTRWTIVPLNQTQLPVPAFRTNDPLTSYRFSFTISRVPDPCAAAVVGDSNCDGVVDFDDIDPFVAALTGEAAWQNALGGTPTCLYQCVNDINGDGVVNFADIDPFVQALSGDQGL
jgi:hypothetical protein